MRFKRKDIVTLDFETYYSTEYSLTKKKYNTSGYIMDPQFHAHCIGIRDGNKKAVWYEGSRIKEALKKHDVKNRPVLAHNTAFDGFILGYHYDIIPPYYLDTLAMSRGLHGLLGRNDLDTVSRLYGRGGKKPGSLAKVKGIRDLSPELLDELGDYCAIDTDECAEIAKIQLAAFPEDELDLIDWTVRCFCDPVLRIDQKLVAQEYREQVDGKAHKQRIAGVSPEILLSADLFAGALEQLEVVPPIKISKTTGLPAYAFAKSDANFKALLDHDNDKVVALVEARLATKSTIGETRAKRFLDIGNHPLPVGYNYALAHTLRWSGSNKMNLQNLLRGGILRRSIKAPVGYMMTPTDSGQIEARFIAWLAGHEDLLQAYRDFDAGTGADVYALMAAMIYDKEVGAVTKAERFIGKVCVLGLGFGMGPPKFRATLAAGIMGDPVFITEREAARIVYTYREVNRKIVEFWKRCERILTDMMLGVEGTHRCIEWEEKSIWLPNGLALHYHGLNAMFNSNQNKFYDFAYLARKRPNKIYGALLAENITQALARVAVGEQLLTVNKRFRVVGMLHDEIIPIAPKELASECLRFTIQTMRTPPSWASDIPLNATGGISLRYS